MSNLMELPDKDDGTATAATKKDITGFKEILLNYKKSYLNAEQKGIGWYFNCFEKLSSTYQRKTL